MSLKLTTWIFNADKGSLLIGNLPPRQRLDCTWPRRKLAVKATAVACTYYPEARLVAALLKRRAKFREFLKEEGDSEPQAAYSYALAGCEGEKSQMSNMYELRFFNPNSWMTLWEYALLPGEAGLVVEAAHLKDSTSGATVPLVVVGTAFSAGEDYPCSGRVLLFELTKNESSTPSWNGRLVYAREFKGPVTGVSTVQGYLLLSTGNRIETCILKSYTSSNNEETKFTLQRSAFYEGPSLVTSLHVVKNFILLGDVLHSLSFLRYKDQGKQISLLSKDFGDANVRSCQFIIAGSSLHLVMSDGEGNIRCFTYTPNDPSSWKGQKLTEWGSLHVGKGISCMLRTRMSSLDVDILQNQKGVDQPEQKKTVKQGVLCGTDSGGFHVIFPLTVEESNACSAAAKRFMKAMVPGIVQPGGLNPAAFRRRYQKSSIAMEGSKPFDPPLPLYEQGIIDGDLLMDYIQQPTGVRSRIAAASGTDQETLSALCDIFASISL